jgi:hypothetical protein
LVNSGHSLSIRRAAGLRGSLVRHREDKSVAYFGIRAAYAATRQSLNGIANVMNVVSHAADL